MQGFRLLCLCVLGCCILISCNNKTISQETIVVENGDTITLLPVRDAVEFKSAGNVTSLVVFEWFKQKCEHAGILHYMPDTAETLFEIDSAAYMALVQDTAMSYLHEEGYSGYFIHAVVDTYAAFMLVCAEQNMGDGGDFFNLYTYNKQGTKIAEIWAAEMPGEESEYVFNLSSVLKKDTLISHETHCRYVDAKPICDSFVRYTILKPDGRFNLLRKDSVLDSRLDSVRKEMFSY